MSRIRCECGQQFAAVNLSGQRRTACPFCRAPVHTEPVLGKEPSQDALAEPEAAQGESRCEPIAQEHPPSERQGRLDQGPTGLDRVDPRNARRYGLAMLGAGLALVAMPLLGFALGGPAVETAAVVIGAVLVAIGGIATAASLTRMSAPSTVAVTKAVLYVVMALMALVPPLAVLAVVLSYR